MGISLDSRTSSSSARVITLCPSGHDVNKMMDRIIADIIRGTVEGIPGKDPNGEKVTIFLDPITFLGDYPAVTAVTDTLGHTANSFCTLCSMRKREDSRVCRIVYSSTIHSRRMSFCRFKERMDSLPQSSIPTNIMRKIGMTGREPCLLYTSPSPRDA